MRHLRIILLAFLTASLAPQSAFAHAQLVSSIPENGAVVPAPITQLELVFTKVLRVTILKITREADKAEVPLAGSLPEGAASVAKIAVKPLIAGAYRVSWTGVSRDAHVISGTFSFTVTGAPPASPEK